MPETASCLACGDENLRLWCEAADREYYSTPDRFRYLQCAACQSLSISPVPEDRLAQIYPANYYSMSGEDGSFVQRIKLALDRRLFRKLFATLPGETLAALDVGGGAGWMLTEARAVEPRLKSTTVVDLDPAAQKAAEAAGHRYVCGRIEDFVPQEKFDLIMMFNLIEHVKDPVAVLNKMAECLKPQGRILLKTPNADSLDARLFRQSYWGGLHAPRHWVLFTPGSFRNMLVRTPLKAESISMTQGAPFWAVSVADQLVRWGVIRADAAHPLYRHPVMPLLAAFFALVDFVRAPFMRTSQMFVVLKRSGL